MQSDSEIEDWELWADPREIERRKAERARARVPPEERRKQVPGTASALHPAAKHASFPYSPATSQLGHDLHVVHIAFGSLTSS